MANKMDNIVKALTADVHNEDGWLSDAQDARLEIEQDGRVYFNGEGSIDLNHIAEIAARAAE